MEDVSRDLRIGRYGIRVLGIAPGLTVVKDWKLEQFIATMQAAAEPREQAWRDLRELTLKASNAMSSP